MIVDFSNFAPSEYAAWWGATIATLALLWNIIVALRSGPRVRIRVRPNMKIYPRQPITEDNTYISVTAINHGTAPTTITHCCGRYASSLWNLLRRQHQYFVVNTDPRIGKPVPYVLAPGEEWGNLADQDDLLKKFGDGYLYIGVIHNQKKNPIYKRVKLNA